MKKALFSAAAMLAAGLFCVLLALPAGAQSAKTTFVTIGTGGITGVYYPTGGAIAKMVNDKRDKYGIRCTVEATAGSVYNVNSVVSGDLEFGLAQADRQYQAVNGLEEWKDKPQKELRAVFSLHPEALTLVASEASGVKDIRELKGKRVNIGNPGSGQRQNSIDALSAVGIDFEKDIKAEQVKAAEAPGLLQDGRIDAFFYTVGHPSGAFKEATAGATKVRFVSVSGTEIEKLLKEKPYYAKTAVPVKLYSTAVNDADVETFGVKATFVTSAKVAEDVVYAITKEVFENLDEFKKLHPAYESLTKAGMLEGMSAEIHPGAMKYYKEAGLIK
ncbi:MAG: C4-dicarboxylate ABC transporter substrate-binding protein [Desulfobacteraceae bacterium IS3]|nr:MAG: C4-dicarboxylate ABC transporter substrate-binding protein [Desulfobacteraceae bacterium IS3]